MEHLTAPVTSATFSTITSRPSEASSVALTAVVMASIVSRLRLSSSMVL